MSRICRSAEYWFDLVKEFEASELSQVEFARTKKVNVGTFRHWLYKKRKSQEEEIQFVELTTSSMSSEGAVNLLLPSDVIVEFPELPDPHYLSSLLQNLEKGLC